MSSLNKVTLIGHVGKDPEIKSFHSSRFASFALATSEKWTDKATGERKEKTEWHFISVMNEKIVDIVEKYVRKGSLLYVEGALSTEKYKDKDTGTEKQITKIVLKFDGKLQVLSSKNSDPDSGYNAAQPSAAVKNTPVTIDDDIPF